MFYLQVFVGLTRFFAQNVRPGPVASASGNSDRRGRDACHFPSVVSRKASHRMRRTGIKHGSALAAARVSVCVYGVVLEKERGSWRVDVAATQRRRSTLRQNER